MASLAPQSERLFEDLVTPLTEAEAIVEADRCLECGGPYAEAPCITACPAGVDVPGVHRRDRAR